MTIHPFPIIGFAAFSGVGKTTLLEQLIPLLRARGLRVALVKHGHHALEIDYPGKDSMRLRQAGASPVLLASTRLEAMMTSLSGDGDPDLDRLLGRLYATSPDLVLVEGFKKRRTFPKIELHRPELGHPLLCGDDPSIIALASDQPLALPRALPLLDINDPAAIAAFILTQLLPGDVAGSDASPGERPLPVDEAQQRINARIHPLAGFDQLALRDALGRVLRDPVLSPVDVPAHTNSAMDGFAIDGAALPATTEAEGQGQAQTPAQAELETAFTIAGEVLAGHPMAGRVAPGHCVRIMTGGAMPAGTDTVVMQEDVRVEGNRMICGGGHETGQNVRRAGEDLARGREALEAGRRLHAAELGLLASLGISEVQVFPRPRVAFFSTGDELRSIGQPLAEGQIYDSNRYTLFGMLERLGCDVLDMGVIADEPEALRRAILGAARRGDMALTSGGVSVGEADLVKQVLQEVGELQFWRLAIKPGRPLAFGHIEGTPFFGLPGNPVAVMVSFMQFVRPALLRMMGCRETGSQRFQVECVSALKKRPGRTEFQRGILFRGEHGGLAVRNTGKQGSGILRSMSLANCFIVLPHDSGTVQPGEKVWVEPFFGLMDGFGSI